MTDVFVVTDSAWLNGPYTHYIDNIRYGGALITSPRSECRRGDGDGDFEDKDGHKHHAEFHRNSCDNGGGSVRDDDDRGRHFESTSVSSSTFEFDQNSQTLTMIGTGVRDGLPVGFTMIAVDNGDLGPGLFTLILTDGYSITGSLTSGSIVIQ